MLCWSGGGPSSYRFAVRHPDRVTAVVSCAAVSRRYVFEGEKGADKLIMDTGFGRRMLQLMAKHAPEKLVSATIASEGHLTKEQVAERVAQIMADPDKEEFTLDLAKAANHSGPRRDGFENDMRQFAAIESLELDRIGVPCLVVQGEADSDVDPEYSRYAAATIAGAELGHPAGRYPPGVLGASGLRAGPAAGDRAVPVGHRLIVGPRAGQRRGFARIVTRPDRTATPTSIA